MCATKKINTTLLIYFVDVFNKMDRVSHSYQSVFFFFLKGQAIGRGNLHKYLLVYGGFEHLPA